MRTRLLHLLIVITFASLAAAACGLVGGDDEPRQEFVAEDAAADDTLPDTAAPATQDAADNTPAADDATVADVGAPEPEPEPAVASYVVQDGDTLGQIAFDFDATVDVLVALNNLPNANSLRVGQELRLPGSAEETDATVTELVEDDEQAADDTADPPAEADPAADDPVTDDEPVASTPAAPAVTGLNPAGIPQPGPDVTSEDIPQRPGDFDSFAVTALPWLQGRAGVDEILPIFFDWGMPSVFEGDRLNLIDTDLDGLASVVIVWTNPFGTLPWTESTLAVYDPIPELPGRYRLAYDHRLVRGEVPGNVAVLQVIDMTGDGRRDITFMESTCGASTCTTSFHLLVRDGSGYRDAVLAPIDIPTAHSIDVVTDATGDGLPDLTVSGGTFGSVGAEPQREFRWIFSGRGGVVQQVSRVGLGTDWLVWALLDANDSFDQQDWAQAITRYNVVLGDNNLAEFAPFAGEADELRAFANLRKSLALGVSGDSVGAQAAAQALSGGDGLVAELGGAYLTGLAGGDVAAGCQAFNNALATRSAEWDSFWSNYGYGVPQVTAQQLCPF